MPFIDDDLLWCPDNDGKMVDLSQCLANSQATGGVQQPQQDPTLGELSQSDLTTLVDGLSTDADDLFKLDTTFELDNFFTDFEEKEENNNTVQLPPGDGGGPGGGTGPPGHLVSSTTQPSPVTGSGTGNLSKNPVTCALLNAASRKYTIAAANPLLAAMIVV